MTKRILIATLTVLTAVGAYAQVGGNMNGRRGDDRSDNRDGRGDRDRRDDDRWGRDGGREWGRDRDGWDGRDRRGDRWDGRGDWRRNGDNDYFLVQRKFSCASEDYRPAACSAKVTGLRRIVRDIKFDKQISRSACEYRKSYEISQERDMVYVRNGCRATFIAEGITDRPLPTDRIIDRPRGGGHGGRLEKVSVTCESQGYAVKSCGTGLTDIRNVYVTNQLSRTACTYNGTYSVDERRGIITVRNGCRAIFSVEGRR